MIQNISELNAVNKTIHLLWIPGHTNIPRNDSADIAAKLATTHPSPERNVNTSEAEIKSTIKQCIKIKNFDDCWQIIKRYFADTG